MKLDRNKLLFIGLLISICGFIILYALQMGETSKDEEIRQPRVPELVEEPEEFSSKLEAVDAIKEERQRTKPSLYGEEYIDSTGTYDPEIREKQRQRIVDSIYREGRIDYGAGSYRKPTTKTQSIGGAQTENSDPKPEPKPIDFSKAHTAFFGSRPIQQDSVHPPVAIKAVVNGEQRVRAKNRLELRLMEDVVFNSRLFKRNTLLYGFVSFRANRVFVAIDHIGQYSVRLKAYDIMDGGEGIYVENSYREEAKREVLDDAVQDINLPGMPQLGGIKQVFRRSNRTVRVTVHDGYQLILKSENQTL
ncbi:conjugative transposon protein TraM [Muricauda oceani]|uniref:Conjugative transposon protein TraM n=1 Tax=Flagellimonas oceani TaxID=2698672 RepID=A0A6G7J2L4_9FLAO|nr:conjugative transposon protein TraM [Allomuricauda oceani]MBW8244142.1 conjugative transposon protein TraM [Allomuricauda oceani]QII45113.1 conjugative transposon protein TraM [Allomuricauda oceani]